VTTHKFLQREGNNLYFQVPITMVTATLGGSIEVPTLDGGKARVSIPEATQSGAQFRLKGKGMPALRTTGFGDLFIRVSVETPSNLTPRQKELLEEFEKEEGKSKKSSSPNSEGFFKKIKDFWSGSGK
jgi:molecular chaperone DnaJ